jgi:hypothetical protein
VDYGDEFYVTVRSVSGRRLFSAGRFHPAWAELDCIGIIVLSHTSKRIVFTLGAAYHEFAYPRLRRGMNVTIYFAGATSGRVVRY